MHRPAITDLLLVDDLLSDAERATRDAFAAFVDREVLPGIGGWFREGHFPRHLIPELARLGVFGGNLQGHGCAGWNSVTYGLALQELERGDSGLRTFASVQGSLVMFPIHAFGSEAQKARWLPELAAGRVLGCFGLTEPTAGSNPGGMQTRARREGDGWVLDGEKAWITNGAIAELGVVWAKTDDGGPESVRGFLVDMALPGVRATEIEGKFSLRASTTASIAFEGVRLSDDAVLPGVKGLKGPLACLNQARAGIGFSVTGAAIACFESARAYALERLQFDRPLAGYQLTQAKLADMLQEIVKAQLLGLRLLRLKDEGRSTPDMVSLLKRNNVAAALEIARVARGILGANGVSDAWPPIRHLLNLESVSTYEGTHEVHTLVLGKAITGLDAFR